MAKTTFFQIPGVIWPPTISSKATIVRVCWSGRDPTAMRTLLTARTREHPRSTTPRHGAGPRQGWIAPRGNRVASWDFPARDIQPGPPPVASVPGWLRPCSPLLVEEIPSVKASGGVHVARMSPFCRHETLEKRLPASGTRGFLLRENSGRVEIWRAGNSCCCQQSSPTGFDGTAGRGCGPCLLTKEQRRLPWTSSAEPATTFQKS